MIMLPIIYSPASEKYFRKLKDSKLKKLYLDAIVLIRENPNVGDAKSGDLKGVFCYDLYYNRVNYEIAYMISKQENGDYIVIILAGTRENFYHSLKNYFK